MRRIMARVTIASETSGRCSSSLDKRRHHLNQPMVLSTAQRAFRASTWRLPPRESTSERRTDARLSRIHLARLSFQNGRSASVSRIRGGVAINTLTHILPRAATPVFSSPH